MIITSGRVEVLDGCLTETEINRAVIFTQTRVFASEKKKGFSTRRPLKIKPTLGLFWNGCLTKDLCEA